MLIADAAEQAGIIAMLLTFSTRAVADGALLLLALLDILLQHHFRIKDWRFLQAAGLVCDLFVFIVDGVGVLRIAWGVILGLKRAEFKPP